MCPADFKENLREIEGLSFNPHSHRKIEHQTSVFFRLSHHFPTLHGAPDSCTGLLGLLFSFFIPFPDFLMKEETDRTGSILKEGLHLGPDCGL